MQQDLLTPTQTPREAILFSAMLRLPAEVPLAEKAELVEKMLDDLGLMDCADTLIGDEMIRGISGGEKKRTSIGIELVMRPKLIFLDEPTSGLDAFAAHVIMKKVAALAHSGGCNVLTTIHQPSSEVFHGFDKVMLLRKGEALFFGAPPQLSKGLAACGLGCPAEFNLADHALFVVQTEADEKIAQLRATLPTAASRSCLAAEEGQEVSPEPRTVAGASRAAGFTVQAVQLAKRELQGLWRNKPAFLATFIVPTVLNLFFALIFFQVGDTTKSNYEINSHFGGMTQIAIGGMFGSAQPLLLRFPLDRGIFLREYATSTYVPRRAAHSLHYCLPRLPGLLLADGAQWLVAAVRARLLGGGPRRRLDCAARGLPRAQRRGGDTDGARPLRTAAPLRRLLHTHRPDPGVALVGAVPVRPQVRHEPLHPQRVRQGDLRGLEHGRPSRGPGHRRQ